MQFDRRNHNTSVVNWHRPYWVTNVSIGWGQTADAFTGLGVATGSRLRSFSFPFSLWGLVAAGSRSFGVVGNRSSGRVRGG